jgi:V/A-type H+-transporting ATPase subunit I
MITPMRKYRMLVHQADYAGFLLDLRGLGMAHVQTIRQDLPEGAEFELRDQRHLHELLDWLTGQISDVPIGEQAPAKPLTDLVNELEVLRHELQELERSELALLKKQAQWEPWGNLPLNEIKILRSKGLHFHLYVCPNAQFKSEWSAHGLLEAIWQDEKNTGFVVISQQAEAPLTRELGAPLPVADLSAWSAQLEANQQSRQNIRTALAQKAAYLPQMQKDLAEATDRWAMTYVQHHTARPANGSLCLLGVYVPAHKAESLEQLLHQKQLAWESSKPQPDDEVPVKLSNARFTRLFHPIGDLFALPSYQELDLTPFFAPFFTLFFGMCLGDVGYGLLIVLAVLWFRSQRKYAGFKAIFTLAIILGSAAMLFGALTGTVFGSSLAAVVPPEWKLRFLSVDTLFNLSLLIGLFQILFGMVLRMINRSRMYGWVYGLSTLGWILGILGGGWWYLGESMAWIGQVVTILGVGLIVFYSNPEKGFFGRLGQGLWDLYGITGLFGDVLSYIRLFALGLASGILGLVVNSMAFATLSGAPVISWLFFVLILLVGHGLNFAISTLSAFVHPVRLTFVEFYKNAGFVGGGKPYRPFKKAKAEIEHVTQT